MIAVTPSGMLSMSRYLSNGIWTFIKCIAAFISCAEGLCQTALEMPCMIPRDMEIKSRSSHGSPNFAPHTTVHLYCRRELSEALQAALDCDELLLETTNLSTGSQRVRLKVNGEGSCTNLGASSASLGMTLRLTSSLSGNQSDRRCAELGNSAL